MLLEDIKNKKQIDAIAKHSLDISLFNSKEDLSKHLLGISKKKYYEKNKEAYKEYYKRNADVIKEKHKEKRRLKKESKIPLHFVPKGLSPRRSTDSGMSPIQISV